jgi:hypothetical protein
MDLFACLLATLSPEVIQYPLGTAGRWAQYLSGQWQEAMAILCKCHIYQLFCQRAANSHRVICHRAFEYTF